MEDLTLTSPEIHQKRESCWPEILKRVPASQLGVCRCVSKKWNSLITSKTFISSQINFLSQTPLQSSNLFLLRIFSMKNPPKKPKDFYHICHDTKETPKTLKTLTKKTFQCPFKTKHGLQFRLVGSVNGIIFLSDDFSRTGYTFILWNPIVSCFIQLPKPRLCFDAVGVYSHVNGVGYDSVSDDFKVVRIVYPQRLDGLDETPPRAELYSVNEGKWRWVPAENIEYCTLDKQWSQCFLKGSIHWLAFERFGEENGWSHKRNVLLLFNIEKEKFMMMKLPLELREVCPLGLFISEWRGMLCVNNYVKTEVNKDLTGEMVRYDMWVKKEYNKVSSWTKVASIDLTDTILQKGVYWRKNGECLGSSKQMELVSYDHETGKVVEVAGGYPAFYEGCSFVETLAFLNKDCKNRSFLQEEDGSSDDEELDPEKLKYDAMGKYFGYVIQLDKFRRQF